MPKLTDSKAKKGLDLTPPNGTEDVRATPIEVKLDMADISDHEWTMKLMPAQTFYDYEERKVMQGITLGNDWLFYEVFKKNNQPLTDEDLDDLSIAEIGILTRAILEPSIDVVCHDNKPFKKTKDFSIRNNRFKTVPRAAHTYFAEYAAKLNESRLEAYKWGMFRFLSVNGLSLNGDDPKDKEYIQKLLTDLPPDGIGIDGILTLIKYLDAFLSHPLNK